MSLRKRYDARFKAQAVLEALRNQRTIAQFGRQLCDTSESDHEVEAVQ